MPGPQDSENKSLTARLGRARFRAFLSLALERLTVNVWRILTWCGLFGGLWLFQAPLLFGTAGAVMALLIFAAGFFYFLYRDISGFRWPSSPDIDRRIEQESRLRHRPLTALGDTLANPQKPQTRKLWLEAHERAMRMLDRIRAGAPRAFMASRDPYAIRLGVLLFFALGLYAAGPAWNQRIAQGLMPVHFGSGAESPDKLTLWITPPDYTGLAPIVIKGRGKGETIDIPAGSVLKISVRSGASLPHLLAGEDVNIPFNRADDGNYILETPVPAGDRLKIRQGFFVRAFWPYRIIADTPPQIALKDGIEIAQDGPIRFPIEVEDDYGVKTLTAHATLNQSMSPAPLGAPVNESRAVMSPPKTKLALRPVYDLTSHPWAGQPVYLTFTVEDGLGQKTSSEPVLMILPERPFKHPVAKSLVAVRKKLILRPVENYRELSRALEEILVRPGLYQDDKIVFLALRSAASRLFWADPPTTDDARAVIALLWDTALRIEDGEISIAARKLRDVQRKLESALDNKDTPPEEIQKLMNDLRAAMAEYFIELQREIQKRVAEGQIFPMMPPGMMAQNLDAEAIGNFLEQLEARLLSGDKKAAQDMMGQLQRLLDMMDPSMAAPLPADIQMMSDGIGELQELIKRQRALLNQTQSQAQALDSLKNTTRDFGTLLEEEENSLQDWKNRGMPPPPTPPTAQPSIVMNTSPHKTEQESLRHDLGEIMLKAGEILNEVPENMGKAEQEMRGSSAALGGNDPGASIPHQEQALQHLEQAQQKLSDQLMARLQQMTGFSLMDGGMKFDPLGRPLGGGNRNGMLPGSTIKIPDEGERKKAQEILNLLRRRSSELDRPNPELDYYKRLLKQF